jgi:hypothetical protein
MEYNDGDEISYGDENKDVRNYEDPQSVPFQAITNAYEYRSVGPKSRGPTPMSHTGRRRPDDIARQAQAHMQEAASVAAYNVLQSQVR